MKARSSIIAGCLFLIAIAVALGVGRFSHPWEPSTSPSPLARSAAAGETKGTTPAQVPKTATLPETSGTPEVKHPPALAASPTADGTPLHSDAAVRPVSSIQEAGQPPDRKPEPVEAPVVVRENVRLEGTIRAVDTTANRLVMDVSFVTTPGGKFAQLEPSGQKTIAYGTSVVRSDGAGTAPASPADLSPGALVSALGTDYGSGHSFAARQLWVRPAIPSAPGSGSNSSSIQLAANRASTPAVALPGSVPSVWVCGDSMAQDLGMGLVGMIRDTRAAYANVNFKVSSGLSMPGFFNWPDHFREGLQRWNPNLVVVMVGTNDAQGFIAGRQYQEFGTVAWQAEYSRRLGAAMDILCSGGRQVIWVGMPVMRSDAFGKNMSLINKLAWEQAAVHPGVTFFDTWMLFSTTSGLYTNYLPGTGPLRASDGIHLDSSGVHRLARALFGLIDQRLDLQKRRIR